MRRAGEDVGSRLVAACGGPDASTRRFDSPKPCDRPRDRVARRVADAIRVDEKGTSFSVARARFRSAQLDLSILRDETARRCCGLFRASERIITPRRRQKRA